MTELRGEPKVYSEFFTNVAVAWFSAGVITPLFIKPTDLFGFLPSAIAIVASWAFLNIASAFAKEVK